MTAPGAATPPEIPVEPPAETVDIAVLGGGLIGVCIALALRDAGHDVLLVDRGQAERAASFGNAGVVSRGSIFPVVGAGLLRQLPGWLAGRDPAVRLPWRHLPGLVPFGLGVLRTLSAERRARAVDALDALCGRATAAHRTLLDRAGLGDALRPTGFLSVYRDRAAFDAAAPARERLMQSQIRVETVDADGLAVLEPGLAGGYAAGSLVADSASVVDPGAVCAAYADLFARAGGRRLTAEVAGLSRGRPWQVATDAGPVRARQVVVALGAWTRPVLAGLGHRLPLVAERGYHAHFKPTGPGLGRPVHDAQGGFVVAPQSRGLRLTTGSELAPIGAPPTPRQLDRITPGARQRLPLGERVGPVWMGGRPTLPDSLPALGPVPGEDGLWLAVGHQHIGFSLSAVTGRLMAALIDDRPPPVDPAPYAPARWLAR